MLLMLAAFVATCWMARKQDELAADASRRMVAGGIQAFAERTKTMLLDYALWTDAYDRSGPTTATGDDNIGASADIGTFDMPVIAAAGATAARLGAGGGPPSGSARPAALAAPAGCSPTSPRQRRRGGLSPAPAARSGSWRSPGWCRRTACRRA